MPVYHCVCSGRHVSRHAEISEDVVDAPRAVARSLGVVTSERDDQDSAQDPVLRTPWATGMLSRRH